jgi:SAM-dependent methyltransferase
MRKQLRRHRPPYLPSFPGRAEYWIPAESVGGEADAQGLPVPPADLWVGYGRNAEEYLVSGKSDIATLADVLGRSGYEVKGAKRVLELGCAAGRMLRHVPEVAPGAECWGTDISADCMRWCRDNLSPPMHFALTTMVPSMPFPDGHFDLVFCGSVFTHIEDLEQSWLLELGRILAPGGRLYLTIHDEHTVGLLDTKYRDSGLGKTVGRSKMYREHRHHFNMLVVGRANRSQVFYNSKYFRSFLPPTLACDAHVPEAYGYQSAMVLRKR